MRGPELRGRPRNSQGPDAQGPEQGPEPKPRTEGPTFGVRVPGPFSSGRSLAKIVAMQNKFRRTYKRRIFYLAILTILKQLLCILYHGV